MVHCGYDPSGALGVDSKPGDTWRMIRYNFGPRPAPSPEGRKVNAYTGYSIGKGHLAEAKAAIKSGLAGARSSFQHNGGHTDPASSCDTGVPAVNEPQAKTPEPTRNP
jgi:hypothetical protein